MSSKLSSGQAAFIKWFVLPLLLVGALYVLVDGYGSYQACKKFCQAEGASDFKFSLAHKGRPASCACVVAQE